MSKPVVSSAIEMNVAIMASCVSALPQFCMETKFCFRVGREWIRPGPATLREKVTVMEELLTEQHLCEGTSLSFNDHMSAIVSKRSVAIRGPTCRCTLGHELRQVSRDPQAVALHRSLQPLQRVRQSNGRRSRPARRCRSQQA